jgi:hypothetical protein
MPDHRSHESSRDAVLTDLHLPRQFLLGAPRLTCAAVPFAQDPGRPPATNTDGMWLADVPLGARKDRSQLIAHLQMRSSRKAACGPTAHDVCARIEAGAKRANTP